MQNESGGGRCAFPPETRSVQEGAELGNSGSSHNSFAALFVIIAGQSVFVDRGAGKRARRVAS